MEMDRKAFWTVLRLCSLRVLCTSLQGRHGLTRLGGLSRDEDHG
jgi:hypothetical protein